jgi:hypothetical protein
LYAASSSIVQNYPKKLPSRNGWQYLNLLHIKLGIESLYT